MKRMMIMSLMLGLMVLMTTAVLAQPPEFDDTLPPPPMHHGRFGDKMMANIENLRMMKLLETVDLSEEQSEKFIPLFYDFRKDVKALIDNRNDLVDSIKAMVVDSVPGYQIKEKLAELKENRARFNDRQNEFISDCEKILTIPQLARLVIFQERFEREMLESLREFRRHGGGPGSMNRQEDNR